MTREKTSMDNIVNVKLDYIFIFTIKITAVKWFAMPKDLGTLGNFSKKIYKHK